jgi:hypothetical protein
MPKKFRLTIQKTRSDEVEEVHRKAGWSLSLPDR